MAEFRRALFFRSRFIAGSSHLRNLTMFRKMPAPTRHFTAGCFDPKAFVPFYQPLLKTSFWLGNCPSNRMKRATTVARHGDCNAVNLYIHDGAASCRFEIEGCLSGNAATQVEQAWCTASSVIGDRSLVVSIGNLTNIDSSGRKLLRNWHEAGAFFVAKSPLTKTLVGSIVGQPVMTANTCDGRSWLRTCALPLIPLFTLFFPPKFNAASLEPTTSEAWENYVDSASKRMEQRLRPGSAFLWVDEAPERVAMVRAGEIVISPVGPQIPKRVPSGLIHDWVGAVFIPNVTLKDVLHVVRDYGRYKELYQPTVIASKPIARSEAKDRFSMVLISTSY
jgi:hypothetical protein